jgi:transcriptional regulator with GAF, ATPase, and Fis domain
VNSPGQVPGHTTDIMSAMPRDLLSERIADLSRDLRSEASAESTLGHVVVAACEMIDGCDSAGITLVTRQGKVHSAVSTDELHDEVNRLQGKLREGPCLDALWREDVVVVPDLAGDDRWSRWRPRAVQDHGLRGMICVRLFTHEDRIGALNLFSRRANAFSEDDVEEAVAMAAQAAVAYATAINHDNLTLAMTNRTVIGQATGLTMARYHLDSVAALALLKRLSSEQNKKLAVIATDVVTLWNEKGDL